MDSGDDSPGFALEWAVKDMVLALDAAPGRSLDVLAALRTAGSGSSTGPG